MQSNKVNKNNNRDIISIRPNTNDMGFKRYLAFSMAEVIFALSIVGIMAVLALTLNHMPNHKQMVAEEKLAQVVSSLQGWGKSVIQTNETGFGSMGTIRSQEKLKDSLISYFLSIKNVESSESYTTTRNDVIDTYTNITLNNGVILKAKYVPDGGQDFPVNDYIIAFISVISPIDKIRGNLVEEYMLTSTKLIEVTEICKAGTYAKDRECIPCEGGQTSEANSRTCYCPDDNPYWYGGECISCDDNEFFDENYGCATCDIVYGAEKPIWNGYTCVSCEDDNDLTPIYDIAEGSCVNCAYYNSEKTHWDSDNQTCNCPTDKPHWYNGICNKCSSGEILAADNIHCCPQSRPVYDKGHCCPTDTLWNEDSSTCTAPGCPADTPYWYSGECHECPKGLHKNANDLCVLDGPTDRGHCGRNYIPIYTAEELYTIGKGSKYPHSTYPGDPREFAEKDIKYPLSEKYCLMNDIDFSGIGSIYSLGSSLNLITGKWSFTAFSGILDGNNHTIAGLVISRGDLPYAGLFALTSQNATIKNIGLVDVRINYSPNYAGGLVGYNKGTVENSYVSGYVDAFDYAAGILVGANSGTIKNSHTTGNSVYSAHSYAGGLVGINDNNGTIENCYSTVKDSTSNWGAGGLVGLNNGTIENSYSTGDVRADTYGGGLVGINNGTIENSYSTGDIKGTSGCSGYIGGFAGIQNSAGASISNSYSTGNVISLQGCAGNNLAGNFLGGFVGSTTGGTISNSYSAGNVTGGMYMGGFYGYRANNPRIVYSYYDSSKIEINLHDGFAQSGGYVVIDGKHMGRTTEKMQSYPDSNIYPNWDTSIWEFIQGQYPKLKNVGGQ